MDDLDHRLISELRVNARSTIPTLGKILGVARGTVQTRLDRLIANGTIAGFTVRLREHANIDQIRGVMMIELLGKNVKGTVAVLRKDPGFTAVYTTNGVWDLIADIEVQSMTEFLSGLLTLCPRPTDEQSGGSERGTGTTSRRRVAPLAIASPRAAPAI